VTGMMTKVEMIFYSNGGWEWGGLGRVAYDSGANSMLQFRLKRGGDGTNHCRKRKRSQRARLGSMGRKHDMARHRGVEREEITPVGLT
jgi:hypothetical protein